jgi:hypothetical protein
VTNARAFYTTRAATGAAGTRRFLRPLFSEGPIFWQNSGALRRENDFVMPGLDPGIHLWRESLEEDGSPGQAR